MYLWYTVMVYTVIGDIDMGYLVTVHKDMACIVMACTVMEYVVIAYAVMAYIVMTYVVMA